MDCMAFLSPILQIVLFFWNPVYEQFCYLKDLDENVATLTSEMQELKNMRVETQADVEHAVSVGKTRVPAVEKWLVDVGNIEMEVDSIKSEFDQRQSCLCGCHCDHCCRYGLGKRVVKKIKVIADLKGKAVVFDKDNVAVSPRRPLVQEMQLPQQLAEQSTSEKMLEMIWQCLHDEKNSIVCVYGMGGVGKTTLMRAINNRFIGTNDFNVVIWVTVSQDLNLGLIQEKIGEQLYLAFGHDESIESRRSKLFPRLKNVRYMLILDDLWQTFSLDQVGIPKPDKQNRCKIAITTRLLQVGDEMDADSLIRVKTLENDEAWKLFCDITGDVVLSHDIQPLAEQVVRECGGLPLAIKTVGGAMRRKHKKVLWEDALRALRGAAPEIPGMERQVFLPLKLSYDSLEDPKLQFCFLYCSLYPEDSNIPRTELVTQWAMEEGLIENVRNLDEALNKGYAILERLMDACLLEERPFSRRYHVTMHDLLRDLAIWITSPSSPSSSLSSIHASKFLVKAGEGLLQPPEQKFWEGMTRVSLMQNKITDLQIAPNCPHLVSLSLCSNKQLDTIHAYFFELMPKLQILDLTRTGIVSIPESVTLLVNLHALILKGCYKLVELPPLGQLKELQLLVLSETGLRNLPEGIVNLVKLKQLDLSCTKALSSIPSNLISRLTSLEYLGLLEEKKMRRKMGVAILREAFTLPHLTTLTINLSSLDSLTAHDFDHRIWSDLRRFDARVGFDDGMDFGDDVDAFYYNDADKMMSIHQCNNFPPGIQGLIRHADYLEFEECRGPSRLSQFRGDTKRLRCLQVVRFYGLQCFIDWNEVQDGTLECLEKLHLCYLDDLRKLFDGAPLPRTRFQQLREIEVRNCRRLRCLFSSNMVECLYQLEELEVVDCHLLEEIVEEGVLPDNPFPRLRSLHLVDLWDLSRVCSQQLIFLTVEYMCVRRCPELKKLPFLSSGIQVLRGEIRGNKKWWEGLECENERSKSLYSTLYTGPEWVEEDEEHSEHELVEEEEEEFLEEDEDASEPEQKEEE